MSEGVNSETEDVWVSMQNWLQGGRDIELIIWAPQGRAQGPQLQLHGKQMAPYLKKQLYPSQNWPKLEGTFLRGTEFPMTRDEDKNGRLGLRAR